MLGDEELKDVQKRINKLRAPSGILENVPLSSSSLQKSQYVLKLFIFSLPDHIEYNSLTGQFTRLYILISALVLVFGYTGISGHC